MLVTHRTLTLAAAIAFGAAVAVGGSLLVLKSPHLRLAARLSSRAIDGRLIPVVDSARQESAVLRPGRIVTFRCGDLLFDAPLDVRTQRESPEDSCGSWLKSSGLECLVFPPRHHIGPREVGVRDLARECSQHGIDWEAAICAASGKDLSFWMSAAVVESLQEQLEVKSFLCMSADRVEVVRGKQFCGLLLIWNNEGRPHMRFDYFSPDNQISGTAFLSLDSGTPQAMSLARAVVSSFRVDSSAEG